VVLLSVPFIFLPSVAQLSERHPSKDSCMLVILYWTTGRIPNETAVGGGGRVRDAGAW
jgi:hypothetical protein